MRLFIFSNSSNFTEAINENTTLIESTALSMLGLSELSGSEKVDHSYHVVVSMIVFLGFYGWKLKKKQFSQFQHFRVYHIFMYLSILATLVMTVHMFIPLGDSDIIYLFLVTYERQFLGFQHSYMLILVFLQLVVVFFAIKNERKTMIFGGVFLLISRIGTSKEKIILEIFQLSIQFEYLDAVLHTMSNSLLILLYFRWVYRKFDVDQKRFCIIFQGALALLVMSISKTFHLLLKIVQTESRIVTFEYISYVFYLPYLWIISCYICYSQPVLVWVQNQEEFRNSSSAPSETTGGEVVVDIPMEAVASSERRASIETTVSYVNLDEDSISVVMT